MFAGMINFFKPLKPKAPNQNIVQAIAEAVLGEVATDPDPVLKKLGDRGDQQLEGLTADPVLFGVMNQRKLKTLSGEFKILAGSSEQGREPSQASVALADNFSEDLKEFVMGDLINNILDAIFYGFVPIELTWEAVGSKLRLKGMTPLPRRWFAFTPEGELRFFPANGGVSGANIFGGEEIKFGKILLARNKPTYDNPYGERVLSRCLWPVAFRKGGYRGWVRVAEDLNLPLISAKFGIGTSEEDKQGLLAAIAAGRRSGTLISSNSTELEVHQPSKGSSAQIHQNLIEILTEEMTRAVLTQTLTSSLSGGGSRAASETHKDVLDELRQSDQKLVKNCFATLAKIYRDLNDETAEPPEFHWFEAEDPSLDWVKRDQGLTQTGVQFTKSYYEKRYGLKDSDFGLGLVAENSDAAKTEIES